MSRVIMPISRGQLHAALAMFGVDDPKDVIAVQLSAAYRSVTVTVDRKHFDAEGQSWDCRGEWILTLVENDPTP